MRPLVGIDFDNTIVCYDALFHRVCYERGLIPEDLPLNKTAVRDYLRRIGQEDAWTEIQGHVYGARMHEAEPFPGVLEFFKTCREVAAPVCIISHKTRYPFQGVQHDLHAAAWNWLRHRGFFDPEGAGLAESAVYFELTKQAKLERVAERGCTCFVDDLPEFFSEKAFPRNVQRFLFDPNGLYQEELGLTRLCNWGEARALLL